MAGSVITPREWELGGEIMDSGMEHPALRALTIRFDEVKQVLAEIQKQSANLKKVGVGRTEDPTLILARLVPQLRDFAETVNIVADQLTQRLGG